MISVVEHFSYKSLSIFRNSTPRNRSRTTKIVHRGLGVSSDSHFSAETPMDCATSLARNSPFHINRSEVRASVFERKLVAMLALGVC